MELDNMKRKILDIIEAATRINEAFSFNTGLPLELRFRREAWELPSNDRRTVLVYWTTTRTNASDQTSQFRRLHLTCLQMKIRQEAHALLL